MAEKELQVLEELIRTVSDHLLTKEEKVGYLSSPELKQRLYAKFPDCFMVLQKTMGRDISPYLFPLCNRAGIMDPLVIKISYKLVGKLLGDSTGMFDVNELQRVLDKITTLKARYEKTVPKPAQQAGRKAMVTRMFNNMKNHLTSQKD